jgi:hypothetical protein
VAVGRLGGTGRCRCPGGGRLGGAADVGGACLCAKAVVGSDAESEQAGGSSALGGRRAAVSEGGVQGEFGSGGKIFQNLSSLSCARGERREKEIKDRYDFFLICHDSSTFVG